MFHPLGCKIENRLIDRLNYKTRSDFFFEEVVTNTFFQYFVYLCTYDSIGCRNRLVFHLDLLKKYECYRAAPAFDNNEMKNSAHTDSIYQHNLFAYSKTYSP